MINDCVCLCSLILVNCPRPSVVLFHSVPHVHRWELLEMNCENRYSGCNIRYITRYTDVVQVWWSLIVAHTRVWLSVKLERPPGRPRSTSVVLPVLPPSSIACRTLPRSLERHPGLRSASFQRLASRCHGNRVMTTAHHQLTVTEWSTWVISRARYDSRAPACLSVTRQQYDLASSNRNRYKDVTRLN